MSGEEGPGPTPDGLSSLDHFRLTVSSGLYTAARVLRVNRVKELLLTSALTTGEKVWLLGRGYAIEEDEDGAQQKLFLDHFDSIQWFSYRSRFTPIAVGDATLTTDAGWGCTLRSSQMLVAQGLQRSLMGPGWRTRHANPDDEPPEGLARLLKAFWDAPSPKNPLSVHNLCLHGRVAGITPGRWLGPWAACKALALAWKAGHAHQYGDLGLEITVLAEPGGVPVLHVPQFIGIFGGVDEADAQAEGTIESGPEATLGNGGDGDAAAPAITPPPPEAVGVGEPKRALLLLIPLVLGIGKLNPVYLPQLKAVLEMPQCLGIVGGRPSSSLYFVGYQGDTVLYLDPHQVQEAACSDADWRTFSPGPALGMPFSAMDPSLAIGFHCASGAEYADLVARLVELEARNRSSPLACVSHEAFKPEVYQERELSLWEPDDLGSSEEVLLEGDDGGSDVEGEDGGEEGGEEVEGPPAVLSGSDEGDPVAHEPPSPPPATTAHVASGCLVQGEAGDGSDGDGGPGRGEMGHSEGATSYARTPRSRLDGALDEGTPATFSAPSSLLEAASPVAAVPSTTPVETETTPPPVAPVETATSPPPVAPAEAVVSSYPNSCSPAAQARTSPPSSSPTVDTRAVTRTSPPRTPPVLLPARSSGWELL